eukprot:1180611-Prorocentrum_minimum.AAC.1
MRLNSPLGKSSVRPLRPSTVYPLDTLPSAPYAPRLFTPWIRSHPPPTPLDCLPPGYAPIRPLRPST